MKYTTLSLYHLTTERTSICLQKTKNNRFLKALFGSFTFVDFATYGHLLHLLYISDKLPITHSQSDHLSRRFKSVISERDSRRSKYSLPAATSDIVKKYIVNITVRQSRQSGVAWFFRIFWYKVWILSLIPDKINIIKMKEGILKCLQILHLIYNDFIQMSLK